MLNFKGAAFCTSPFCTYQEDHQVADPLRPTSTVNINLLQSLWITSHACKSIHSLKTCDVLVAVIGRAGCKTDTILEWTACPLIAVHKYYESIMRSHAHHMSWMWPFFELWWQTSPLQCTQNECQHLQWRGRDKLTDRVYHEQTNPDRVYHEQT